MPTVCQSLVQEPCPEDLQERFSAETLQFTLVDCPGHASLLKTVLVGAQIIDMMLLVIDATKGIQTQTAECIIVGELLSQCAVVALNKTDLFQADRRHKEARRCGRHVVEALQLTRFAAAEIVPVAAKIATSANDSSFDPPREPGAEDYVTASHGSTKDSEPSETSKEKAPSAHACAAPQRASTARGARDVHEAHALAGTLGIEALKDALLKNVPQLKRDTNRPFLFMADHCFQIKGHGTVLSGVFFVQH